MIPLRQKIPIKMKETTSDACPKCGRKTQAALGRLGGKKGAISHWSKLSAAERSEEMSRRRRKGMMRSILTNKGPAF